MNTLYKVQKDIEFYTNILSSRYLTEEQVVRVNDVLSELKKLEFKLKLEKELKK